MTFGNRPSESRTSDVPLLLEPSSDAQNPARVAAAKAVARAPTLQLRAHGSGVLQISPPSCLICEMALEYDGARRTAASV